LGGALHNPRTGDLSEGEKRISRGLAHRAKKGENGPLKKKAPKKTLAHETAGYVGARASERGEDLCGLGPLAARKVSLE